MRRVQNSSDSSLAIALESTRVVLSLLLLTSSCDLLVSSCPYSENLLAGLVPGLSSSEC